MKVFVKNIPVQEPKNDVPNLVLLHGWGSSSDIWQSWLVDLTKNYSVTLIDIPGLGVSSIENEYTLDNVIDAMTPYVPRHSILLGWSLGGMLSILLAQRLQDKVNGVITIASNPCFVQRKDWSCGMVESEFQTFQQNLLENEQKTLSRFCMLQVRGGSDSKNILSMIKEIAISNRPDNLSGSLAFLNIDARMSLQRLAIPSLHILAEMDQLVPVVVSEELLKLSTFISVYKVVGAGHLPFLSDKELLNKQINSFISNKILK